MTNTFDTCTPCHNNRKLVIIDGSLITVVGVENIELIPYFTFTDVLHVPKLSVTKLF